MDEIILKPGRDKSVKARHPWIFEGAIERVKGSPVSGANVLVRNAEGIAVGIAAFSPVSQIRARVWTVQPEEVVDAEFFRRRLVRALAHREHLPERSSINALRLVNSEGDGLPGLIADLYADWLVVQFLSAGAEFWRDTTLALLRELLPGVSIYERSDSDGRRREGLEPRAGLISGAEPPEAIEVSEGPWKLLVDVKRGHKTGLYLDQRDNREAVRLASRGKEVLNCFCYTGGFSVAALAGGATMVESVDASEDALALARRNCELNGGDPAKIVFTCADVFQFLRRCRDARKTYDVIILDPPKFADSKVQVDKAARGYMDINLLAFKLLRPGGTLFTYSCSGLVETPLFKKIVSDAALDAGREALVVRRLSQSACHPVPLSFPEGEYLKGLQIACP